MGRIVAQMFLDCSDSDKGMSDFVKSVLKPELIIRDSSIPNK
jgi:hypothetical protein